MHDSHHLAAVAGKDNRNKRGTAIGHMMMKCCFMSTETVGLGAGAQDVHLDFHTAPEL